MHCITCTIPQGSKAGVIIYVLLPVAAHHEPRFRKPAALIRSSEAEAGYREVLSSKRSPGVGAFQS